MTVVDERYLQSRQVQSDRKRSDLEEAFGERFWALLDDPAVREVNIRPNGYVSYQRLGEGGGKYFTDFRVAHGESENIAHAIVMQLDGRQVLNEQNHYVNCKLRLREPDEAQQADALAAEEFARIHIVHSDATADGGYAILARKHNAIAPTIEQQIEKEVLTPHQGDVLKWTVAARKNLGVIGAMFAGKSTMINTRNEYKARVDPTRSVAYIQDVPETICPLRDRMGLTANAVTSYRMHCREVFRHSVEEVSINELRGPEAYDLIHNIWLAGANGGEASWHGIELEEAMWRLGTMVREAGVDVQNDVLAKAVHVLMVIRFSHKRGRKVTDMVEVTGYGSDGHFKFKPLSAPVKWEEDDDLSPPPFSISKAA